MIKYPTSFETFCIYIYTQVKKQSKRSVQFLKKTPLKTGLRSTLLT